MTEIINFRNKVRDILRKYEEIIFPILRLIWCFLVFTNIHHMFNYVDVLDRPIVRFLLAVLCAVLPDGFLVFAASAVIGVNCFFVNLEAGLAFMVVFMVMYCMYIRFFPKHAYAIFLVPICYAIGMPYLAPVLIIVITGMLGALPAAFGVLLYFFSDAVREIRIQLISSTDDSKVEVLGHFVDKIVKNREMYLIMMVFAAAVITAAILYKFSFPFSHFVAILAGGICLILYTVLAGAILKQSPDTSAAMGGAMIGVLFGLIVEVCKGVLDYPHTQRVQFEDDEYYYYVKAIPKLDAPKKKPKVPGKPVKKGVKPGEPGGANGAGGPNENAAPKGLPGGPGPNQEMSQNGDMAQGPDAVPGSPRQPQQPPRQPQQPPRQPQQPPRQPQQPPRQPRQPQQPPRQPQQPPRQPQQQSGEMDLDNFEDMG